MRNIDKWVNLISSLHSSKTDIVPDGWETSHSLSENLGIPQRTMNDKIREAMREGRMEHRKFRVKDSANRIRHTSHYKIIK